MAVIFVLSSMRGSGYHTSDVFYFIERKSFHIIEYFILFVLFYGAVSFDLRYRISVMVSAGLVLLYGISDEWHQTFVFGREGTIRDVLIDFFGILVAIIFIHYLKKRKEKVT